MNWNSGKEQKHAQIVSWGNKNRLSVMCGLLQLAMGLGLFLSDSCLNARWKLEIFANMQICDEYIITMIEQMRERGVRERERERTRKKDIKI